MKCRTRNQLIVLVALIALGYLCVPSGAFHSWRDVRDLAYRDEAGVFRDPMKFLGSVKTVTVGMDDLPYYTVPPKQRNGKIAKFVYGKPGGKDGVVYGDVLEEKVESLGFRTVKIWKGEGDGRLTFVVNYTKPIAKENVYIYSARLLFGLAGTEPETVAYEIERLGVAMESELEAKVLADWYALADTFAKDCRETR